MTITVDVRVDGDGSSWQWHELHLGAFHRIIGTNDELESERFASVQRVVIVHLQIYLPCFQVIGFNQCDVCWVSMIGAEEWVNVRGDTHSLGERFLAVPAPS